MKTERIGSDARRQTSFRFQSSRSGAKLHENDFERFS